MLLDEDNIVKKIKKNNINKKKVDRGQGNCRGPPPIPRLLWSPMKMLFLNLLVSGRHPTFSSATSGV